MPGRHTFIILSALSSALPPACLQHLKKPTSSVSVVPLSESQDKAALRTISEDDWTRKDVSAIIRMTTEFLRDMDMKMRDVRRVERYYYGTKDFGAGRIFSQIETKFEHMCTLYKNTSAISRVMFSEWGMELRKNVVGSLQFMLSDYMEMLGLIDLFKERYSYWRANTDKAKLRDIITRFLLRHGQQPSNYEEMEDTWRRAGVRRIPAREQLDIDNTNRSESYSRFGFRRK